MATMVRLLGRQNDISDETYDRIKDAEDNRPFEFHCIIKVQAWFRAQKVRSYIKHLNISATLIQKRWRGFLGRSRYRKILRERIFIMKLNYYNYMATQIQKTWKGYYTRKYTANYYSRKRYLDALAIKNEIIRSELEGYVEQQEMNAQMEKEKVEKMKQDDWVEHHHFLLSTHVQPGVYNSPYLPYPDRREFQLRNLKVMPITGKSSANRPWKKERPFDPAWESYNLHRKTSLPPVKLQPQGPFRDPAEVQRQRYKPFQPSLRVSTDYFSLIKAQKEYKKHEWVTHLDDDNFQPMKTITEEYDRQLHSDTAYGHQPYGNRYFREEFPDRFLDENFRSIVPPIPIIDKLNDTYSMGQV